MSRLLPGDTADVRGIWLSQRMRYFSGFSADWDLACDLVRACSLNSIPVSGSCHSFFSTFPVSKVSENSDTNQTYVRNVAESITNRAINRTFVR